MMTMCLTLDPPILSKFELFSLTVLLKKATQIVSNPDWCDDLIYGGWVFFLLVSEISMGVCVAL